MIRKFLSSLFLVVLAAMAVYAQDDTAKLSASRSSASTDKERISKNVNRYTLSVEVEPIDASKVQLSFSSAGPSSNLDLRIHMVKINGDGTVETRQEPMEAKQKADNSTQQSNRMSDLKVIVPNSPEINGIEIVWNLDAGDGMRELTILVPITPTKETYTVGLSK